MNTFKRSGHLKPLDSFRRRSRFELLEDRRLMAVVTGQSTFEPVAHGRQHRTDVGRATPSATGTRSATTAIRWPPSAAAARPARPPTMPERSFSSMTEMDISSVSKTVTATAILHFLQSQPGGLDAALSTPLADYLPSDWTPGANVQFVTLRHLLTHTQRLFRIEQSHRRQFWQSEQRHLCESPESGRGRSWAADRRLRRRTTTGRAGAGPTTTRTSRCSLGSCCRSSLNPGINLTAANYADRDLTSGTMYKEYVQDEIFEPLGIVGADLDVTDPNPTMGYVLGSEDTPGLAPVDRTRTGGAGGWKLSARELARFLDGIQRDNSILSAATRQMRNEQELGWYQTENAFGESFSHNGANGGSSGMFRSQIVAMPGDVEVGYLMNSGWASLPGGNIFNMLEDRLCQRLDRFDRCRHVGRRCTSSFG